MTSTHEARDALILEHLDWARDLARQTARKLPTWFTVDDLVGPAEVALIELATKYDPRRGVPFRAWASRVIRWRCISAIRRKEYTERARPSLSANRDADDLEPGVPDPALGPHELAERHQEASGVWSHVRALPLRYRIVIEAAYFSGDDSRSKFSKLAEAARVIGVCDSRASQLHREALRMLRAAIETGPQLRRCLPRDTFGTERGKCWPLRPPLKAA